MSKKKDAKVPLPGSDPHPAAPATEPTLTKVLDQSERVTEMVKESAEELASVNADLKRQMVGRAGVKEALERNAAVEQKVEKASEELVAVNQALESEVRDRDLVDHRLAAITEQEQASRHASLHDVLTRLPNRALFNDRLEHGIAQASRHARNLAVLFLDLDKFKSINDTHGHEAGDVVLREVALRLKDSTRGDDTVSRLGGDEFLFLLTEVRDQASIVRVADKILGALQAPIIVTVQGVEVHLNIRPSIGIAVFPKDGTTVDTLIISADMAMYQAKRDGSGYLFAT